MTVHSLVTVWQGSALIPPIDVQLPLCLPKSSPIQDIEELLLFLQHCGRHNVFRQGGCIGGDCPGHWVNWLSYGFKRIFHRPAGQSL